jgi:alkylhydroperoxidase family enzyme
VNSQRIPIATNDELRDDVAELLPLTAQPGREPPATMATLAHHPALFTAFLGWASALALAGVLSKRDHEILALRTAWRCRSVFEWAEHVEFARRAGLNDNEISAIARPVADQAWSARETSLLDAADELAAENTISDSVWSALASQFDHRELVEILFVVGRYTMLSLVANAAGVAVPADSATFPPA